MCGCVIIERIFPPFVNNVCKQNQKCSVAKRGEFSRFVGFLAQKGGQIFEDGELWDFFKKGGILKNFTKNRKNV